MPAGRPPKRPPGDGMDALNPLDNHPSSSAAKSSKLPRIERGPEDFSSVVKNKLQSYTRTGQACDRCKVCIYTMWFPPPPSVFQTPKYTHNTILFHNQNARNIALIPCNSFYYASVVLRLFPVALGHDAVIVKRRKSGGLNRAVRTARVNPAPLLSAHGQKKKNSTSERDMAYHASCPRIKNVLSRESQFHDVLKLVAKLRLSRRKLLVDVLDEKKWPNMVFLHCLRQQNEANNHTKLFPTVNNCLLTNMLSLSSSFAHDIGPKNTL